MNLMSFIRYAVQGYSCILYIIKDMFVYND